MIFTMIFSMNSMATTVKMSTTKGDIYIELYDKKMPNTVKNFLSYVNDGFYEGTVFHRVISTFMIQGGGFDKNLTRLETKTPIKNEANIEMKNLRGTIAMARLPSPHSATAQFFINVQDNPSLNHTGEQNTRTWGYAVFGHVVQGMEVVDDIRFTPTGAQPPFRKDVPQETIEILSINVVEKAPTPDTVDKADS